LNALRIELKNFTNSEIDLQSKRILEVTNGLKHDIDSARADLDSFKIKEFRDLENRVAALEKMMKSLSQ